MNNLINITKRNEILDAIWYGKVYGKDLSSISLKDMMGPVRDILDIGQLLFGKYRLVLIYDKRKEGLHSLFPADKDIAEFISNHIEEAFKKAITEYEPYIYVLNIASVENFGAFTWEKAGDLLNKQLNIFMPIIQKFIVVAMTDTISSALY